MNAPDTTIEVETYVDYVLRHRDTGKFLMMRSGPSPVWSETHYCRNKNDFHNWLSEMERYAPESLENCEIIEVCHIYTERTEFKISDSTIDLELQEAVINRLSNYSSYFNISE